MVIEMFLEWVKDATVQQRVEVTWKLVDRLKMTTNSIDEREEIISSLTALCEDPSPEVRHALALALGSDRGAPRHIILALANDAERISNVVLTQSTVIHDAELIELVEFVGENGQISVANRPWVSSKVCASIANYGAKSAAITLLKMKGLK